MNDNLDYFKNIDIAIEYFNSADEAELLKFLKNEDEVIQQIALLNLKKISSQEDAELVCDKLTKHSSETREYCSFLINRLMKNEQFRPYFKGDFILEQFANSISDVNPKVCRKIIEILPYYIDLPALYSNLIKNAFVLLDELKEKNKNKNYQYNTKSFHLYWHTFALGYTLNDIFFQNYKNELYKLTDAMFTFYEYTLREKAAFLLKMMSKYEKTKLKIIQDKYNNEDNFYVKEILS